MPNMEFNGRRPAVHGSAFIAPSAWLIGDVRVEADASVWFNAVIRAEWAGVVVGEGSNVQDCVVVHPDRRSTLIGRRVTVGHGAVLEGVVLEDEVLIGIGARVLEGSRVGRGSIVAAGSLIPAGMDVPPGNFVAGAPARVVGRVKANMIRIIQEGWRSYSELKEKYRAEISRV